MPGSDDNKRLHSISEIENWNLDRSVDPPTKVVGIMTKDGNGSWNYAGNDAGNFRVSAIGVQISGGSFTSSPLSADSSSVSAIQADAGSLRMSAFSPDASGFRVSAIGVSVSTSPLSADSSSISAKSSDAGTNLVSSKQGDASLLRTSAIIDSGSISAKGTLSAFINEGSISAKSSDAGQFLVSAAQKGTWSIDSGSISSKSADGSQLRVSAVQQDAGNLRISAIGVSVTTSPLSADSSSVSSKQADASNLRMSAIQGDAGNFRISAIGTVTVTESSPVTRVSADILGGSIDNTSFAATQTAANSLRVSALVDAGSISAKSGDAGQFLVSAAQKGSWVIDSGSISAKGTVSSFINEGSISAKSGDASLLRISARSYPDTTGALTVFQTLSVSASQNIKSTAGAVYGYYAYNTATNYNYLKLYNVSGAVNKGTDTPILTIGLPPSAAANQEFSMGFAGFSNGIGIAATSGAPVDNTANPAASAVGLMLFYK